ncbi:ABC transporter substrate-binding protein [Miltoncostaea oceani]|jgi:iron complex transport system substrate-binding protein|uniref:ABC transporter substrate-binding protein n=1 Tax=Miltoncostaea oceani TaxID=2843216 RepID=UPI001C3DEAAD|nr:ABC transporter substrate-binding protein [Miltoncostaea oceani]
MRTPRPLGVIAAALVAIALASGCGGDDGDGAGATAPAAGWSWTDGSGKTVELETRPTRIIAHAYSAAALMEFGIRPIAIYADAPLDEDVGLRGVDFSGIEVLGQEWGRIDVEKAATLDPDLIVGDYWPVEEGYSGMEDGVEAKSRKLAELAPVVGPAQGGSIVTLIEGYEDLAESLGADVGSGPAAEARAAFEEARDAFRAAAEAKPGLTALAISPYGDSYAVAVPEHAPELLDLRRWGLDVIVPSAPDPEFPYWQTFSFENADTHQPDLLLFDDRNYPANREVLEKQPIARSIRAFAAGSYTTWPAYWLHTYGHYAEQLEDLTEAITSTDPTIGS